MNGDISITTPDGTELSSRRVGSGSGLVLVHGGILSKEAWQFVEPLLAERHTVWSYDRRGHGSTSVTAGHSLDQELEDLAAVMDAAGGAVHLVGHSDGAFLCLEAAAHHPGLRSLVLYEPPVHFDRREAALRRAKELLDGDDLEGFLDVFLTQVAAAAADEVAVLRSIPEAWGLLVRGARLYAAHADEFASRIDEMLALGWHAERYRSVAVPTLLLVGALTESPLFATADEMRAAVPHAEVAVLDGQRHMAAAFDAAGFATAVLGFTGSLR